MRELFESYKSNTDQKYRQVLTTFKRKLTHPARNQETELGNLFADMMQEDSSFDLMILGSGSLRLPELGPVLHVEDLKVFFPYDDALHLLEVTGEQLKRMVAFVLRDEAWEGHTEFYQYSKGFHVKWSKSRHEFLELPSTISLWRMMTASRSLCRIITLITLRNSSGSRQRKYLRTAVPGSLRSPAAASMKKCL